MGATLEQPSFEGAIVGNTFLCLIADQFLRLKQGDRFFYEHGGQSASFTSGIVFELVSASFTSGIVSELASIAYSLSKNRF